MKRDIITVENFYKDPEAVVAYAKQLDYYYPYQGKAAVERSGIVPSWLTSKFTPMQDCPFRSSEQLITALETLTGDKIDRSYWNRDLNFSNENEEQYFFDEFATEKIKIIDQYRTSGDTRLPSDFTVSLWNCAFQVKTANDQSEAIHNHITDYWQCCGEMGWNGIVYLNKTAQERTGIKFWKNKQQNDREWMTEHDRWSMIDDMGNVYNRLILFRGSVPHSGAPGFGNGVEDGRLFQTFFFRTVNPQEVDPVFISL